MKSILFLVLVMVLVWGLSGSAAQYQVIDLGEQGSFWGELWRPLHLNDQGVVCGTAPSETNQWVAFSWRQGGGFSYVPADSGWAGWSSGINNSGVVAGTMEQLGVYLDRAFSWTANDPIYLKPYSFKMKSASAMGINEAGVIAGYAEEPMTTNSAIAVVWTDPDNTQVLPTPIPRLYLSDTFNLVTAINNKNQVVGYSGSGDTRRGFIWTMGDTAAQELGLLAGTVSTVPTGINDAAVVVGYSVDAGYHEMAFIWQNETIAALPMIGEGSKALGLNEKKEIVGTYIKGEQSYACLWAEGVPYNLNELAAEAGWVLQEAQDINESGWIVGTGTNPQGEAFHGYLLIPQQGGDVLETEIALAPSHFNLNSNVPRITCTIWAPAGYTIADIHLNSIRLNGTIAAVRTFLNEAESTVTAQFKASQVRPLLISDEVELAISGELTDQNLFQGTGTIRVMDKGKKK